MATEARTSVATRPSRPQALVCTDKGQGSRKAQRRHEACLSLGFGAESGLEVAFGLDLPTGARKISNFKALRPQVTSKWGTMKALGSKSLGVKGGEKIRNLFRKGVLRDTSPSLGAQASLGATLYLCPSSPNPSSQHCPPGYGSPFEAHLSWFQGVGCQLELRVRWEGNQNLGSR